MKGIEYSKCLVQWLQPTLAMLTIGRHFSFRGVAIAEAEEHIRLKGTPGMEDFAPQLGQLCILHGLQQLYRHASRQ